MRFSAKVLDRTCAKSDRIGNYGNCAVISDPRHDAPGNPWPAMRVGKATAGARFCRALRRTASPARRPSRRMVVEELPVLVMLVKVLHSGVQLNPHQPAGDGASGDDLERAAMALADPHDAFPALHCFTFVHRDASFCFTYLQV